MMTVSCSRCGAPLYQRTDRCGECGFLYGEEVDLWLGKRVGGFLLLRRINHSTHNSIYESHSDQPAAIKLLHHQLDPELNARLRREALAIQRLAHPATVRFLAQGETDTGHLWVATELILGETLRDRVQRRLLSEHELFSLMSPLCGALEEAHQKGITHRDLTPRNIMIQQRDGAPKLLDFGFAALRGDATITEKGVVNGTPAYMAPEQWRGLSAGPLSDLYSLAVIAYQCLSGVLPVDAKTPLQWLTRHHQEQPTDLKTSMQGRPITQKIYQTIMRALQKDPAQRQSSIHAFLQGLEPPQ
jgi:serine/threonine protein kinase